MSIMTEMLTWKTVLGEEKQKPYFEKIMAFLDAERAAGKTIYPPQQDIFNALKLTPYESVKVVIIGQDPYHGPNQAHGLSFSVRREIPTPPSLLNIFEELHDDLNIPISNHGCLESWARQGVLMLNSVLTVSAGKPQSHAHIGWQTFTDRIICSLNDHPEGVVYLLWGSYAQRKHHLINTLKHKSLKAPHPSPLSAHRGFFGCKHFSKTNQLLQRMGREPINWNIAD